MSKDDERAALEKIRKIVKGLGENSYVATAFLGAFELAEENIDYDAAFSTKWYVDNYTEVESENIKAKAEIERINKIHSGYIEEKEGELERIKAKYEEHLKQEQLNRKEAEENLLNMSKKILEQKKTIGGLTTDIIILKAKIYDLITKEAVA